MKKSERRGQLLVNSELQLYLIFYAVIFGLVFVFANVLADRHFEQSLMEAIATMRKSEDLDYLRETVSQIRGMKTQITSVVSLIFLAVWAIQAYFMSHRIAGPVFKATRYLNEAVDPQKRYNLKFRKGDFFNELAEAINVAIPPPPGKEAPPEKD